MIATVPAGFRWPFQTPEVGYAVADVVIRIDQQRQIDRSRQHRIARLGQQRRDVLQIFAASPHGEVLDHVGLDVHRVDTPSGGHVRDPNREVARSCADVGHHRVRSERKGLDHFMRPLPAVACRVIEHP